MRKPRRRYVKHKHHARLRHQKKKKKVLLRHKKRHYHLKKKRVYRKRRRIIVPIPEPVVVVRKVTRRRPSTNPNRMYFTQDTENAIVAYNKEKTQEVREQIFREKILHPFQKLVENVFNTFKFSYFETGPQDVQKECLTHLVANMHKFDPNRRSKIDPKKKTKAFAYFSIIAKHYLILLNNTNYKKFNQNIEISDEWDEHTIQLQHTDKYYAQQEMAEFISLIIEFWENNLEKIFAKRRDLNIANAVVELFRNGKNISMFNKKALYLYIREMAQCKTQQITKIINKMKTYHDKIKYSYQNEGEVNVEPIS